MNAPIFRITTTTTTRQMEWVSARTQPLQLDSTLIRATGYYQELFDIQGDHLEVYLKQMLGSDLYWVVGSNIIHHSNRPGEPFNL